MINEVRGDLAPPPPTTQRKESLADPSLRILLTISVLVGKGAGVGRKKKSLTPSLEKGQKIW